MRQLTDKIRNILSRAERVKYLQYDSWEHYTVANPSVPNQDTMYAVMFESQESSIHLGNKGIWNGIIGRVVDAGIQAIYGTLGDQDSSRNILTPIPAYHLVGFGNNNLRLGGEDFSSNWYVQPVWRDDWLFAVVRDSLGKVLFTVLPMFNICTTAGNPIEFTKQDTDWLEKELTRTDIELFNTEGEIAGSCDMEDFSNARDTFVLAATNKFVAQYAKKRIRLVSEDTSPLTNRDTKWLNSVMSRLRSSSEDSFLDMMTPLLTAKKNAVSTGVINKLKKIQELIPTEGEVYVKFN